MLNKYLPQTNAFWGLLNFMRLIQLDVESIGNTLFVKSLKKTKYVIFALYFIHIYNINQITIY